MARHSALKPSRLGRNIPLYYASVGLRSFFLLVAINVLYYLAHGLSMAQILLLAGVMSVGMVILEIPTGIFADRFGRRTSLLCSALMLVVGYVLLAFGASFWMFMLAMVAMAAAISFQSGADAALVYDTLASQGNEHKYHRIESSARTLAVVSNALAAVGGSLLYAQGMYLPYYGMIIVASAVFFCTLLMREPERTKDAPQTPVQEMESSGASPWRLLRQSLRALRHDRLLLTLLLFQAVAYASVNIAFRFFQPVLAQNAVPIAWFGIVYGVLMVIGAFLIYAQPSIERRIAHALGQSASLFMIPLLIGLGAMLMLGPLPVALIGMFLVQLFSSYVQPLVRARSQQGIPARERATTLSIMSFAANLLLLIISPLFGFLADQGGMALSLISLGVCTVIVGVGGTALLAPAHEEY